jgi:hypothetical protein
MLQEVVEHITLNMARRIIVGSIFFEYAQIFTLWLEDLDVDRWEWIERDLCFKRYHRIFAWNRFLFSRLLDLNIVLQVFDQDFVVRLTPSELSDHERGCDVLHVSLRPHVESTSQKDAQLHLVDFNVPAIFQATEIAEFVFRCDNRIAVMAQRFRVWEGERDWNALARVLQCLPEAKSPSGQLMF